jgi:beta-lactamase regulating signal transducer with metallopeptidase domain
MSQFLRSFVFWGEAWVASLWRASWQGAIAIALVWLVTRWSRFISARVASWLWRLVCLKLLVALLWVQPVSLRVLPAEAAAPAVHETVSLHVASPDADSSPAQNVEQFDLARPAAHQQGESGPFWGGLVLLVWLAGAVVSLAGVAGQWLSARHLLDSATSQVNDSLSEACRQEAERLGVRRPPRLVLSPHVESPLLTGVWRPAIVLPACLEAFDSRELRLMLAHELAHHRRRDLAWNWLPTAVRVVFFFHPLVWLMVRRWSEAQEAACDELLIQQRLAQPVEYGRLLLKLAAREPLPTRPALATAGVLGTFRNLERRVISMSRVRAYSLRRLALAAGVVWVIAAAGLIPWRLAPQTVAVALAADDKPDSPEQPDTLPGKAASSEAAAGAKEATVLRGHVLLPDGKPAAGAEIYWLQMKTGMQGPPKLQWEKRAVTDDEGHFQWMLTDPDAKIGPANRPPLIAYKPGFGLDGMTVGRDQVDTDLAIKLPENCPIRGRLTDTEGRPVKDAKIVVANIQSANDGSLDRLLEKWKRQPQQLQGIPERMLPLYQPFAAVPVEDNGEGRFTISGVGHERVALLNIVAPGYTSDELRVVTREGFDAAEYNKQITANTGPFRMPGRLPRFFGPEFDHVMEAGLVIRGIVFTGPDRKPVAGARIGAGGGRQSFSTMPTTDADGHFEVRGVRRSQVVPMSVHPGGDLLSRALRLDVAPGVTVLEVEVELKAGIVVEGRIFDQATGLGVQGGVSYVPLAENRFVEEPGYDAMRGVLTTGDDGRFRRLVPPGPGVLMAQVQTNRPQLNANKPKPYRQAGFNEEETKRVPTTIGDNGRYFTISGNQIIFLGTFGAVKVIEPQPDSGPIACDLPLDPGKTRTIAIEDDQGQPVTDAWVAGVADIWPITFKIAESTCTIYALGSDRPRRLCILHPERHLTATLTLTGDEPVPVTVRLGAPATIAGRALDPDGAPLAHAVVQVNYFGQTASELLQFAGMEKAPFKTDADGRFQVDDVLPGERLALYFKQGGGSYYIDGLSTKERQLEAGQKLELGDVKVKQQQ